MNSAALEASEPPTESADWFGQPRGLTILFLTETWDTFSFYGMRALLVLYMTKHLMFTQQAASWIYGGYAAMVYLTPIFGGVIADRWLGRRAAVLLGGTIMAVGHFLMAFEPLLLPALATIAIGNGLFLPSLPSQIDSLYARDDPRRMSAYNVYYVGVNLGAFAAPIVIGTVGEVFGFHWGFALAGIGMVVAMATYVSGRRYLPPDTPRARQARMASRRVDTAPATRWYRQPELRSRFLLLFAIAAVVVVFRGAYEQIGNTLSLWADANVDRSVSKSLTIPVTLFQSLNPLIVFILTPVLVWRWTRMATRGREPSSGLKMAIGAGIVGIAYLLVAVIAHKQPGVQTAWPWLAMFIGVMTAGELFILPVGLGLFGRMAPEGLRATTIAVWFSAGVFGNLFAAWLGTFWTSLGPSVFFAVVGGVALLSALGLGLLISRITRMEQRAGTAN